MADGIDLRQFRQLTKDLKAFKPDKQVKRVLRGAGERIAGDARLFIEPYSQSIPPTIKIRVSGTSVSVSAGGGAKALAREMMKAGYGTTSSATREREFARRAGTMAVAGLFEYGNKGGSKSSSATARGVFRHPVFGSDTWVNQPMRPYLRRAREANLHAIEHLEAPIVENAFKEVGWH